MEDVIDRVEPKTFYIDMHKTIYKAMTFLHYNHKDLSYSTILDRLEYLNKGNDEIVNYVFGLADTVASTANLSKKIDTLVELYQKRKLYDLGVGLTGRDIKGVPIEDLIKDVDGTLEGIQVNNNLEVTNAKEYVESWYEDFKSDKQEEILSFGFRKIDELVMLSPSNLGIIGARPGIGKSAYALNLANNFCKQGKHTLFVSLEMSSKEIMNRLIANYSQVEHDKIQRKRELTSSERKRIEDATKEVDKLNLYIFDRGMMDSFHLENLAKQLKKQGKLDTVIVDYLQLMESGKKNLSGVQDVTYISRKLKQLAQELSIPVIALSQLSRKSVGQDGKPREPQMSDLRESGAIEQDANFILMLHSEDVDDKFQKEKFIKLFVRKNRSGSLGKVDMTYYGDYVTFVEKEWIDGKPVAVKPKEFGNVNMGSEEDLPF